jgi:hypothetical protein
MVPVLQLLWRDHEHGVPLPSVSLFGNAATNLTGHEHIVTHGSISSELGVLKTHEMQMENAYEVIHLTEICR